MSGHGGFPAGWAGGMRDDDAEDGGVGLSADPGLGSAILCGSRT